MTPRNGRSRYAAPALLLPALAERFDEALFYRELATLRVDVTLDESLEDLEWQGIVRSDFEALCAELGFSENIHPDEWASQ